MSRRLTLLFLLFLVGCHRPPSVTPSIPFTREAYVWQQTSSPALNEAVRIALPELDSLSFHAADIRFGKSIAEVQRFPLPWAILKQSSKPLSLVIRIHSPHLTTSVQLVDPTRDLIHELLASVRENSLTCREIQLDYDCPDLKLASYAQFLQALQQVAPEIPIHITALPSWLKKSEFTNLAAASGEYILQVHSLTLPRATAPSVTLFDPITAWVAIHQAAKIGTPFRLALPTYRCTIVMDARGQHVATYSENSPQPLDVGQRYISGTAEPAILARFVAELQTRHPSFLTGLIWYRLPVSTDRMNWPWSTFQLVTKGQIPHSRWDTTLAPQPQGFSTITIHNTGAQPELAPAHIKARWPADSFIATDALGGYTLKEFPDHIDFTPSADRPSIVLQPGEKLTIGWIRLQPGHTARIFLGSPE